MSLKPEDLDYILNELRRGTTFWRSRTECLNRGRRQRFTGHDKYGNNKYVWERNCDICGEWEDQKDQTLEVDHIIEVGKKPTMEDYRNTLVDYIERMYCPVENLQALCHSCHALKTAKYNASTRFFRKRSPRIDSDLDEL